MIKYAVVEAFLDADNSVVFEVNHDAVDTIEEAEELREEYLKEFPEVSANNLTVISYSVPN